MKIERKTPKDIQRIKKQNYQLTSTHISEKKRKI